MYLLPFCYLFSHFFCHFLCSSSSFFSSGLIIAFSGMPVFQVFVCLLYVPFVCLFHGVSNPWSHPRGKGQVETILPKLHLLWAVSFSVFPGDSSPYAFPGALEGKEARGDTP